MVEFEQRVAELMSRLPESAGPSRFLGAYLALRTAEELGYDRDHFRQRPKNEREHLLSQFASQRVFDSTESSNEVKEWSAGFYFNDALLRMAALGETSLKDLYSRSHSGRKAPDDYAWLANWYHATYKFQIGFLTRARHEINIFKHEPVEGRKPRKLETMTDGMKAFRDLLQLLEQIAKS